MVFIRIFLCITLFSSCLFGTKHSVIFEGHNPLVCYDLNKSIKINNREFKRLCYSTEDGETLFDAYWLLINDSLLMIDTNVNACSNTKNPMLFAILADYKTYDCQLGRHEFVNDSPKVGDTEITSCLPIFGNTEIIIDSTTYKVTHYVFMEGCYEGDRNDQILYSESYILDEFGKISYRSKNRKHDSMYGLSGKGKK
jgi:hypothetical protein